MDPGAGAGAGAVDGPRALGQFDVLARCYIATYKVPSTSGPHHALIFRALGQDNASVFNITDDHAPCACSAGSRQACYCMNGDLGFSQWHTRCLRARRCVYIQL